MAESRPESHLSATLEEVADLLLSEQTVESILEVVVSLAHQLIGSADGVGITLRSAEAWTTPAATNDLVTEIDAKQYERGSGPCVSAAVENKVFRAEDLTDEKRWPEFAADASASGVGSMLSVPLGPAGTPSGAMNLYSTRTHAFSKLDEAAATVFARQAGIVIANRQAFARSEEINNQLREALRTRELIGEAKGILMVRESFTDEEAFAHLRRISQNTNRKLRTVAEEVVKDAESKSHPE